MSTGQCVPRLIRLILRLIVPRSEREYFLGDLEESTVRSREGGRDQARRRSMLREMAGAFQLVIGPRPTVPKPKRRRRGDTMLQELSRDLRFGMRMMVRSPGFTIVALITMALGIGANTAMFSVVNGVLLKPLPYPQAERIAFVLENNLERGWESFTVSPLNFRDWQLQNRSTDLMGAYLSATVTYTGAEQPRRLAAYRASEEYLEILGGEPALGRAFTRADMEPDSQPVALLDHGFWRQSFGGDPDVLGRIMVLDGESHTVIGVLPEGWRHPFNRSGMSVLLPLRPESWWERSNHFLRVFARMKPGTTVEQVQADLSAVAAALEAEYPETNAGWGAAVMPLDDVLLGQSRPQLLILLASVGLVLLIACVNMAQMTLARGGLRRHEMAIRSALGAGRGRVVRQLLVESLMVSLLGGALGVLLALGCLRGLSVGWPEILPRMQEIGLDGTVLLFTTGLSLASGVLFGLFPALGVAGSNLGEALRRSGWSVSGDPSRRRLRAGLVVVEVSLAVVLLVGSGLLIRSFLALQNENPGFETDARLAFTTHLPDSRYPEEDDQRSYGAAALEQLAAIPGVESVAITNMIPVTGRDSISLLKIEGRMQSNPDDVAPALIYQVSPGYFETMGMPLRSGRDFTTHDRENAVPVAVVSESFAERYCSGSDTLGKRIRYGGDDDPFIQIVGVVGDVQHYQVGRTSMPQVYFPFAQRPTNDVSFVIKTFVPLRSLAQAVRGAIQSTDRDMPLEAVQTLRQVVVDDMATPRFRTTLFTSFGLTALLLAVVGLYGVMSYAVSQRSREIGIRMALGARRSSILRLVLRDGVPLVATGVVTGLAGALALTRTLESMLFGVGVLDPGVFAGVPLVLAAVAAVAMLIPAVRATRVDPVRVLAAE